MSARYEHYRWWLLDGDLEIVSDGRVAGASLLAALADLSRQIDRLGGRGQHPTNQPYRLIGHKGAALVAGRPATPRIRCKTHAASHGICSRAPRLGSAPA